MLVDCEMELPKRLFAVTRTRGSAWDASRPLEGQRLWKEHAEFMDALAAEGFVLLAGPLEGTSEALLVIQAEDEAEIGSRLATDPWSASDHLRTKQAVPWTLRLGSLGR